MAPQTSLNLACAGAQAIQGPISPALGIAMDMAIILKASSGARSTLSLSFNNNGSLATFFR